MHLTAPSAARIAHLQAMLTDRHPQSISQIAAGIRWLRGLGIAAWEAEAAVLALVGPGLRQSWTMHLERAAEAA